MSVPQQLHLITGAQHFICFSTDRQCIDSDYDAAKETEALLKFWCLILVHHSFCNLFMCREFLKWAFCRKNYIAIFIANLLSLYHILLFKTAAMDFYVIIRLTFNVIKKYSYKFIQMKPVFAYNYCRNA